MEILERVYVLEVFRKGDLWFVDGFGFVWIR